jgi:hypothetical protein
MLHFATRLVAFCNVFLSHFASTVAFCNVLLDKLRSGGTMGWLPRLSMKITISKDVEWQVTAFAKAPLELLLCDDLLPTTKLLWIVLANQANFRPIDRTVLDRRIGIHRSTRLRAMAELREAGFISGTDSHVIVHDPAPILRRLDKEDRFSREIARAELGIEEDVAPLEPKPVQPRADYFEIATEAWNSYRPSGYAKIRRMSSQVLKAADLHIKALGLKPHGYEHFFSTLKGGVEKSDFWSRENSSKTLQSIIGVGQPQDKKYHNVHALYNEGLEHGPAKKIQESERPKEVVLADHMEDVIDMYDDLHHTYLKLQRSDPGKLEELTDRIVEVEEMFVSEGLDPAMFRLKYDLTSWPTAVPLPKESRTTFWRYKGQR